MANATKKLRCGGRKTTKRMAGGGPIDLNTSFAKMNNLDSQRLLSSGLAPGPSGGTSVAAGGSPIPFAQLGDMAGNYAESLIDSTKPENYDNREDPTSFLKTRNRTETAGNYAKNTLKGAGIGATVGTMVPIPGMTFVGAAVGAAVGATATAAKQLFTSKKKKREIKDTANEWSNDWNSEYASSLSTAGYQDGGKKKSKHTVYYPRANEKYDKDLVMNHAWIDDLRKAKNIDEVNNSVIGKWKDKPLTMSEFLQFPERVRNYYKPDMVHEFQKKRFGLENNYQEYNLNPAPGGTGSDMYIPSSSAKSVGNNVVYTGKDTEEPINIKGMAKGGSVKGKGTGKSDSITKKVEDGSFIIPSENADKAKELGRQYLGWEDNETANRNYPGTEVKLSNGEVLFTPEEVDILSYNGIDLNELAPNANDSNKMVNGGEKNQFANKEYDKFSVNFKLGNPDATDQDIQSAFNVKYPKGIKSDNPEDKTFMQKLSDSLPELAGAIQIGAAARGFQKAGEMPDINVSASLKELSTQLRKEAEYGLEPGAKDAMLNQTEKARRDTTNAIVTRGGSSSEIMSNLQGVLSTTIDKKYNIELSDAAEKARKKGLYVNSKLTEAGQEMEVQKFARENWLQMQETNAGLLSAGISNIVGARKLKAEMDAMKKIGSNSPSFIINK